MKRWVGCTGFGWAMVLSNNAVAATAEDALVCLSQSDLVCAQQVQIELERSRPDSMDLAQVEVWNAFHEGDYADALLAMDRLRERGLDLEVDESHTPYRATAESSLGMEVHKGSGVEVRVAPGVDRIVAEEAVLALVEIKKETNQLFGGGPEHTIVLDIFPTGSRFIGASGIPPEAVQTTGVVALSKYPSPLAR